MDGEQTAFSTGAKAHPFSARLSRPLKGRSSTVMSSFRVPSGIGVGYDFHMFWLDPD